MGIWNWNERDDCEYSGCKEKWAGGARKADSERTKPVLGSANGNLGRSKVVEVESAFPSELVAVYAHCLGLVSEPLGGRSLTLTLKGGSTTPWMLGQRWYNRPEAAVVVLLAVVAQLTHEIRGSLLLNPSWAGDGMYWVSSSDWFHSMRDGMGWTSRSGQPWGIEPNQPPSHKGLLILNQIKYPLCLLRNFRAQSADKANISCKHQPERRNYKIQTSNSSTTAEEPNHGLRRLVHEKGVSVEPEHLAG